MNLLNVASLQWEFGGVQRILCGVARNRDGIIFNSSGYIDETFKNVVTGIEISSASKHRIIRSIRSRFVFSRPKQVLVWDDIAAFAHAVKYRADAIFYDHSSSSRNHGSAYAGRMFKKMRAVISCSNAQSEIIKERWETDASIGVCLNGLPESFIIPDRLPVRYLPTNHGRAIYIGMVGRLSFEKGHVITLHAARLLLDDGVNIRLVIAGVGALESTLKRLASRLGIEKIIDWRGHLARPEVVYNELDVLCMPSLWESFGLTAIEAAAYGCPVIAANRGGLKEAVGGFETGILIPPALTLDEYINLAPDIHGDLLRTGLRISSGTPSAISPTDLAEAILSLCGDEKRYKALSENGYRRVCSDFTFDAYLKRLDKCLSDFYLDAPV